MSPVVRLAVRALIAGVLAFGASYQAGEDWVQAIIAGVIGAAVLAGAELGTPVNPTVGVGKGAESA